MTPLALAVGVFVAVIGLAGVIAPQSLEAIARHVVTPLGLYFAAGVRVSFGIVLLLAAPASRRPEVLRIVGFVMILAGLITPFLGVDRARAILNWWSGQGPLLIRFWPSLVLIFGVLIVYAAIPERRAAQHGVAADSPPSLSLGPLASLARFAAERPTVRLSFGRPQTMTVCR